MPGTPTPIRLYQGQPAAAVATIYTAPNNTAINPAPGATTLVKTMVICNPTAAAVTLTLYLVPNGGAAAAANALYSALSVAANSTVVVDLDQYMEAGDFLAALAGTAASLTVTISGVQIQ